MLTHPDKIMYPEDKITKADLLDYYQQVAHLMLPYITFRPLTLLRCPNDYQSCFFQRHFNTTTPKTLSEIEDYIYLKDAEGLYTLVQMSVLEIHPWGSKVDDLEKPDVVIFDLDPAPNVSWARVVESAREIKDYLLQYQLTSFVKTTGGKGLHVVIPIDPNHDWEQIKYFSQHVVQTLEQIKPDEYVSKMTKSKRVDKIFVDYLRNQRTATAIAPYSTRARVHAPVSTPLAWDELSNTFEDNFYTVKTLPARLKKLKTDPWQDYWQVKNKLNHI